MPKSLHLLVVLLSVYLTLMTTDESIAQPKGYNYDEAKVPQYTLPPNLVFQDGTKVTADNWPKRRAELLKVHVYGRIDASTPSVEYRLVSETDDALDGAAVRKEVDIIFSKGDQSHSIRMLMYLPAKSGKSPVFLGLNFKGNHTVQPDPEISITNSWVRNTDGIKDHKASARHRGAAASRWPAAALVKRGYGLATIYYGDIDPDFDDGFRNGIHPLLWGDAKPKGDDGGSIAAWAWGLSRALDYLETDPAVDAKHVAVIGHSRLGKTSLWAGATDPRFAMVISNNSGCGGAALNRRAFGETVKRINTSFPHWFCDNYNKYNDNEGALPVDQHQLMALIAPRPVYVASATQDQWADPRGEFLSLVHGSDVFHLLGKKGFSTNQEFPPPMKPLVKDIAYHLREGKHDLTEYDWQRYMDFADRVW